MSPIVSQASVGACPRRHAIKVVFNQSVGQSVSLTRPPSCSLTSPPVSHRPRVKGEVSASACVPKSLRDSQRSALSVRQPRVSRVPGVVVGGSVQHWALSGEVRRCHTVQ